MSPMPSNDKKSVLRILFTANGSCGCGKSTKAIEVHEPTKIPRISSTHHHHHPKASNQCSSKASSTTTSNDRNGHAISIDDDDFSSTTMSESETSTTNKSLLHLNHHRYVGPKQSPLVNTLAVEKDSSDPYHDFRHSMLQMIFEKEIDSEDDLQELLQCFLHLNATCYHHVIVKAFNEICEEAFSDIVSTAPATTEPSPSHHRNQILRGKSKE